jgi:hypothetical protein
MPEFIERLNFGGRHRSMNLSNFPFPKINPHSSKFDTCNQSSLLSYEKKREREILLINVVVS